MRARMIDLTNPDQVRASAAPDRGQRRSLHFLTATPRVHSHNQSVAIQIKIYKEIKNKK
jgi:hypothetical protein